MAYNFPDSPTPGDVFQKWTWNGEAWVLTAPLPPYTQTEADARFVNVAGDTMTGHLSLPVTPAAANAVRKDYVDTAVSSTVLKAGDTMTGHLSLPVTPAAANAVRKDYVDAAISGVDLSSKVSKSGDAMTGNLRSATDTQNIASGGQHSTFEVYGTGQPCISFHIPGVFGANFGMDAAGDFYFGGWSLGVNAYKIWSTRNLNPAAYLSNGRLPHAGDWAPVANAGYQDAWGGSVASGGVVYVSINGEPWVAGFRMRYVQGYTSGWFTFAYA